MTTREIGSDRIRRWTVRGRDGVTRTYVEAIAPPGKFPRVVRDFPPLVIEREVTGTGFRSGRGGESGGPDDEDDALYGPGRKRIRGGWVARDYDIGDRIWNEDEGSAYEVVRGPAGVKCFVEVPDPVWKFIRDSLLSPMEFRVLCWRLRGMIPEEIGTVLNSNASVYLKRAQDKIMRAFQDGRLKAVVDQYLALWPASKVRQSPRWLLIEAMQKEGLKEVAQSPLREPDS
jgi:hypothetical protein